MSPLVERWLALSPNLRGILWVALSGLVFALLNVMNGAIFDEGGSAYLAHLGGLVAGSLVEPELVRWKAADGVELSGFLYPAAAGFEDFVPDACLVNRYSPGSRLTLHQDKDEVDLGAPVLSVSLGDTATFRIGAAESGQGSSPAAIATG